VLQFNFFTGAQMAAICFLGLSDTGFVVGDIVMLEEQLHKFPALKHLDLSGNAGLSLLPVAFLRVAARLETFNCDGCQLVLPPQLSFSTPDLNPSIIQSILDGRRTFDDEKLELLNVGLTYTVTFEAAALLHCFPFLKHLDLSGNHGLKLLSVSILRVAARLETFNCDGCSLVLPPQCDFCAPDQNPRRIQEMLDSHYVSKEEKLNLSNLGITQSGVSEALALLHMFSALKHLDLSGNAGLDSGAVAVFVKALSGKAIVHSNLFSFHPSWVCVIACAFLQESNFLLSSISAVAALTACLKTSRKVYPTFKHCISTTAIN
jgi:hypothetical protein